MNLKGKDFLFIEEDFFDLDHENKIAMPITFGLKENQEQRRK